MLLEISESSIFAAIELVKDRLIEKKNKKLYQHNINTYDYPNGKQIIKLIGNNKFKELINAENNYEEYKKILRKIIMQILKKKRGPELYSLPIGIKHFLEKFDDNFKQVLESCDLLLKFDNRKETQEIREWWREMIDFARYFAEKKKLESGDRGEEKTYEFEQKKLKKLNIDKNPNWDSYYDNMLGYDIQSWDKDMNKIYIDSKSSSKNNAEFWFSKGEWRTAKSEKQKYFIYLWIQDNLTPRIIDYLELKKYVNDYDMIKEKNAFWPSLKIVPSGKN